mmetsp:Transcript_19848/g.26806  ORF Transcript_19848/g.26806 Transcript_19848/m.26806 type:complete len:113 (+) Transcript_19848:334-672(+)
MEEIRMLRTKVEQLELEEDIVQWYLTTMEAGVDTKKLVKKYAILKRENVELEETTTRRIARLEDELSDSKFSLKNALDKLKKQQDVVVKPLLDECMKREKENRRMKVDVCDR